MDIDTITESYYVRPSREEAARMREIAESFAAWMRERRQVKRQEASDDAA